MTGKPPLPIDVLLDDEEVEALLALLSDVAEGHGADAGVRRAASGAWAIVSNRVVSQGGHGGRDDDPGYYRQMLTWMRSRDRPWRTRPSSS